MVPKILLIIAALAAGVWALTFGAINSNLMPNLTLSDSFPWISLSDNRVALWEGFVVFYVLYTVVMIARQLRFSPKEQVVRVRDILWHGIFLFAAATLWGMLSVRVASAPLNLNGWFLTYPGNIITWFTFAPMILLTLNFLRELNYVYGTHMGSLHASAKTQTVTVEAVLQETLEEIDRRLTDIEASQEKLSRNLKKSNKSTKEQFDGVFAFLRGKAQKSPVVLAPVREQMTNGIDHAASPS